MKKYTLQLPATSANIGPGFDSFGLALSLYNQFSFERSDKDQFDFEGFGDEKLKDVDKNLFFRAFRSASESQQIEYIPLKVYAKNRIPLQGGLGSSATAIIGGVLAAFLVNNLPYTKELILEESQKLENHIDNLVPCLTGGFTISSFEGKLPLFRKHTIDKSLKCLLVHPKIEISTEESRNRLPTNVSVKTLNFQVSKAALLVSSILEKDWNYLKFALQDDFHEINRYPEEVGYEELKHQMCSLQSIYGGCVSGSGPTILFFVEKETQEMTEKLKNHFEQRKIEFESYLLTVCNAGTFTSFS